MKHSVKETSPSLGKLERGNVFLEPIRHTAGRLRTRLGQFKQRQRSHTLFLSYFKHTHLYLKKKPKRDFPPPSYVHFHIFCLFVVQAR